MSRKTRVQQGHGGARPGSGPKPKLEIQIAQAEKLALELQGYVKSGLSRLAIRYPDLMDEAISRALDRDYKDSNSSLMRLIELLPKMVDLEDGNESKADQLKRKWQSINEQGDLVVTSPTADAVKPAVIDGEFIELER